VPETRLIFTTDKSKLNDDVSPKMMKAIASVTAVMIMSGVKNQAQKASVATDMLNKSIQSRRTRIGKSQDAPRTSMYRIPKFISERYPDMMIDPYTVMLMYGMSERDEHDEILAASLAWVSLGRKDALGSGELVEEFLPDGYPSAAYLDELVDYYKEYPDLLWPPELVATEVVADGRKT
jgi:hypothetical protein